MDRKPKRRLNRTTVNLYVTHHNANPKPVIWTASTPDILTKDTRVKAALAAGR